MKYINKQKIKNIIQKHKKAIIIIFICAIPFILETLMIIDTIPIMNEIKDNVSGEAPYVEDDVLSNRINVNREIQRFNYKNFIYNYSLYRKFTLHNFKKGYMIIRLKFEIIDINGGSLNGGDDLLKCTIEKVDGKWKIVDIRGGVSPKFGE